MLIGLCQKLKLRRRNVKVVIGWNALEMPALTWTFSLYPSRQEYSSVSRSECAPSLLARQSRQVTPFGPKYPNHSAYVTLPLYVCYQVHKLTVFFAALLSKPSAIQLHHSEMSVFDRQRLST